MNKRIKNKKRYGTRRSRRRDWKLRSIAMRKIANVALTLLSTPSRNWFSLEDSK